MLQKAIGILIVVLIVVWIISQPAHAGDTIHGWIGAIGTFFRHVS